MPKGDIYMNDGIVNPTIALVIFLVLVFVLCNCNNSASERVII